MSNRVLVNFNTPNILNTIILNYYQDINNTITIRVLEIP
mgnify:CR=1 FL=1